MIATALSAYFLGVRRGWSRRHIGQVMASALPGVTRVILVAGADGAFGKVLIKTGTGNAVADLPDPIGVP
ncbi:GntT/GntP/DsdX family permease [Streptomyces sp. CB01635]|uniref:GntT/GntP/DsdX family permease n=1 Tax=Streptomyces sp. CB01635 TaxID=2020326 RepID=UPI001F16A63D|nr:hypothetical protein [Streptomyces sp. CB01635]